VRIAAVQIHYLGAFRDDRTDYRALPLTNPVISLTESAEALNEWRRLLRSSYDEMFSRKLAQIVYFGARRLQADVVVFPEYSIPLACLPSLKAASAELGIIIIAGSHLVDLNATSKRVYRELGLSVPARINAKAICPIISSGRVRLVQKLTGSKYDPDVEVQRRPVTWSPHRLSADGQNLNAQIYLCSDYLPSFRAHMTKVGNVGRFKVPDVTFVISWSPALGELVSASSQAVLAEKEALQKEAYNQRSSSVVVFVNNADRGGTKFFYNRRNPSALHQEENDGSFGQYRVRGSQVLEGGLPADCEGIVCVDISGQSPNLTVRQTSVCPIVYCHGS
jgi:hypothetical protein